MPKQRASDAPNLNSDRNGQALDQTRPDQEHTPHTEHQSGAVPEMASAIPPLSEADQRHLLEYEKKTQLVRDRVVGVIRGRTTGLYLWGPGGTGMSFTILST